MRPLVRVATFALLAAPAWAQPVPRSIGVFPAVIPGDGSASALVEIRTEVPVSSVTLDLAGGGTVTFSAIDDRTFSAVLDPAQLLYDYAPDDVNRNYVGMLHLTGVSPPEVRTSSLFVNVEDAAIADVPVVAAASDLRCSPHVVNLFVPAADASELWEAPYESAPALLTRFYEVFGNDYDFANLVFVYPNRRENRNHFQVKSDVLGIGSLPIDHSSLYGSAGRLAGITRFPLDTRFDLAAPTAQHELGHQWINFLPVPELAAGSPHWPASDLARGVMGLSIPPTGQGGEFPYSLTPAGAGLFTLAFAEPTRVYTALDLYLMGFIGAKGVPPFAVMDPPDQPLVGGATVTGVTLGIADVLAAAGPRVPSASTAPKDFTMATIVVTRTGLLTAREMAFFDHFAARGEATSPTPFADGFQKGEAQPFALATQGIGSLDTSIACRGEIPMPPLPAYPCEKCPPVPCVSCPPLLRGLDLLVLTVDLRAEGVRLGLRTRIFEAGAAYAQQDLAAAAESLAALIEEIRAQRGQALTAQAADGLTALTRQVARALGVARDGGKAQPHVRRGAGG